jgi:hypothetical protein
MDEWKKRLDNQQKIQNVKLANEVAIIKEFNSKDYLATKKYDIPSNLY